MMPKSTAKWDLNKGSSDVTTKILELFLVTLPLNSVQAEAIARYMMICNTKILREYHAINFEGKKHA